MRNVVGIAIFVASAGACFACAPAPLALKFSGNPDAGVSDAAGASPDAGAAGSGAPTGIGGAGGGATGFGGTPIPDECRGHDVDIPSATLAGGLSISGVPATADPNTRMLLRNGVSDLVEIPFARRLLLRAPGARHLRPLLLRDRPNRDRARQPVCAPAQRHRHHGQRHHHPGRRCPRNDRLGRHHDQRRGAGRGRHRRPVAAQRRRRHRTARRGEQRFIHGAGGAGDVRFSLHVQGRRRRQRHPDEPARADRRRHHHRPRRPRRRWTSTSRR